MQGGIEDNEIVDELVGVDGTVTVEDEVTSKPQDKYNHDGTQELTHWVCSTLAYGHPTGNVAILVRYAFETIDHLVLGNESLDDAQPTQCLLNLTDAVGEFGLHGQGLRLQFLTDSPNAECHQGHYKQSEEGKLPTDYDECSHVNEDEDGILDDHIQRGGDGRIYLVDVSCDTCHDVALALFAKEGEGQTNNLAINVVAYITHNAGSEWSQHGRTPKIGGSLQEGEEGKDESQKQQRSGRSVGLDELLAVVIAVVLGYLQQVTHACRIPRDEVVVLIVDLEENLENGQDDGKRKHVEQCRQYVHPQCSGNVTLVTSKVLTHQAKEQTCPMSLPLSGGNRRVSCLCSVSHFIFSQNPLVSHPIDWFPISAQARAAGCREAISQLFG